MEASGVASDPFPAVSGGVVSGAPWHSQIELNYSYSFGIYSDHSGGPPVARAPWILPFLVGRGPDNTSSFAVKPPTTAFSGAASPYRPWRLAGCAGRPDGVDAEKAGNLLGSIHSSRRSDGIGCSGASFTFAW